MHDRQNAAGLGKISGGRAIALVFHVIEIKLEIISFLVQFDDPEIPFAMGVVLNREAVEMGNLVAQIGQ